MGLGRSAFLDMSDKTELTAADVAEMFGVNETTVYRWEREGMLPKRISKERHAKWRLADIETVRGKRTTNRNVL